MTNKWTTLVIKLLLFVYLHTSGGCLRSNDLAGKELILNDKIFSTQTGHFCPHCDSVSGQWDQCCTGWCGSGTPDDQPMFLQPTPAKVIRLVFHDCMRYADGSGGCDGCINWKNMGIVYRKKGSSQGNGEYKGTFPDPKDIDADNNGLQQTVLALEHLYNDPTLADGVNMSLQKAGKSRADLWALAGIVAVEYSANENNLACEEQFDETNFFVNDAMGCGRRDIGGTDCKIQMPSIPFYTGRQDCNAASYPDPNYDSRQDFKTFKEEKHPDLHGNGAATLKFFRNEFNLNAREATALMGAHSLGKLTQKNSFLKYFWSRGQHSYLSNQYYKSLSGGVEKGISDADYAIQCIPNIKDPNDRQDPNGEASFALIGSMNGQAAPVSWTAHGRGWFKSGGPFSWRRNLDMCFDGQIGHSGLDKLWQNNNSPFDTSDEVWDQCWNPTNQQSGSQWTCPQNCLTGPDFVDEIMLNPDMGLMWNFQVNKKTGRPFQKKKASDKTPLCEGINEKSWRTDKGRGESGTVKCHTEARATTAADVEDFAASQAVWVAEFGAVFGKMLKNGNSGLTTTSSYQCCNRLHPTIDMKGVCDSQDIC